MTLEQREKNRIKAQKYRASHRDYFREYDKKRYAKRQEVRRIKVFEGRKCKGCEILLSSTYGAHGTVRYCVSCTKIRWRLYMREYRKKLRAKLERKRKYQESKLLKMALL